MLFNSIDFLLFLPLVVGVYYLIHHRFRWVLLLIASYYFYMCWKAEFIVLIVLSTLVDYVAALGMEKTASSRMRKMWLGFSLASNLGMLFTFKYLNFFRASFQEVFNTFNIGYHFLSYNLLLPAGISFYTFQTLSYTIDVYRGQKKAEHHFGIFALYVCFFPQLVAGPIERAVSFLPQFHEKHALDIQRIVDGLRMVLWGLFKKIVIADRLSIYVNTVYNNPYHFDSAPTFIMATYFFAFHVYCDFSAYSDIAIGSARMLGFDLMENSRKSYESKSISEFWSRWHISLSTWFRDYLHIPLGGNRVGKFYYYRNLFVIFLVSGLWHGANWTFVIWGALHGFFLVFALLSKSLRESIAEKTGLKSTKACTGRCKS
jgi:D-alanyl-lipoteichoic acid acyltransferase DltB (MBOAT superfamily)